VHDFLAERHVASQAEVLAYFHRDDLQIVRGVLKDLVDSGLVFRAGRGQSSTYRAATRADLEHTTSAGRDSESADMLVWALVYRLGPVNHGTLTRHVSLSGAELDVRNTARARLTPTLPRRPPRTAPRTRFPARSGAFDGTNHVGL